MYERRQGKHTRVHLSEAEAISVGWVKCEMAVRYVAGGSDLRASGTHIETGLYTPQPVSVPTAETAASARAEQRSVLWETTTGSHR